LSLAFYQPAGELRFTSSGLTRGPWSAEAQHGGPPCALLGTHLMALAPEGFRAARLTFEMLRPIGLYPLTVTRSLVRAGQQAAWLEGALSADTPRGAVEVMRARGVLVRARDEGAPRLQPEAVPGPDDAVRFAPEGWGLPWDEGYHTAIELAQVAQPLASTRRVAWIRATVELIEGTPWTPLGRVLVAVDSLGGACAVLPFGEWSFVNAETSCHLLREPEGEWVALAGTQYVEPDGVGLADALLYDRRGAIGRGLQSQVVVRRR
jgi:hypothetical protein